MTVTATNLDIRRPHRTWLSTEYCTYKTVVVSLNFDSTFIASRSAMKVSRGTAFIYKLNLVSDYFILSSHQ